MEYQEFLYHVIKDGIEAAMAEYGPGDKLEGSVAGFEACRGKSPSDLLEVWQEAHLYAAKAEKKDYWWFRCYQDEIEWVCNVVSAILFNQNRPSILSWLPTVRGMGKAVSIVREAETGFILPYAEAVKTRK